MFSREDLECLDPGYFEIIYIDDRDVTIMSRIPDICGIYIIRNIH